ncbi:hypothetical protein [Methanobacterium petrolearium]|uniref:hypothetical protein n=1 Tax=Methanobacterium petrolearium TaxID=710190 RepID=UPI001AE8D86B|nr:hypothetical protein [Methanobacterium petrolearium]MBP1946169.1 hypothetical protein [Methanobacterium petrolearium]BDZ70686.1 hypothetical protein GCM10025861_12030 [Methanobacterium petrolearium]
MRRSLLNPILAFVVLIILIISFNYVGNTIDNYFPAQKPEEITSMSIGDTVLTGMKVIDDAKIRKVPVIYHPEYLMSLFQEEKYLPIINGLLTGALETPISQMASGSISPQGVAQGFEGPGFLSVKGQQLVVNPPQTFVWAYKTGYTVGVKTENGVEIRNGGTSGKVIKEVAESDINNNTIPQDYVSITTFKNWYNKANVGNYIYLDYSLAGFNDGRNQVTPDQIETFFGESVVTYMKNYPGGSPVMAYMGNHTENVTITYSQSLGSYPEYGDYSRAYNAKAFAMAWNGTIIPPKTGSSGKENIGFDPCPDPNATGGYATHGVCPAARALRGATTGSGLPLPSGILWGELSVAYDTSPTVGVKVYNTNDYPIKIVMWTEGSGAGLVVYGRVVKLT